MAPERISLRRRFLYAVSAAFVMAAFLPMFVEESSAVYVPMPGVGSAFAKWCETASNWAYIMAACFAL